MFVRIMRIPTELSVHAALRPTMEIIETMSPEPERLIFTDKEWAVQLKR